MHAQHGELRASGARDWILSTILCTFYTFYSQYPVPSTSVLSTMITKTIHTNIVNEPFVGLDIIRNLNMFSMPIGTVALFKLFPVVILVLVVVAGSMTAM